MMARPSALPCGLARGFFLAPPPLTRAAMRAYKKETGMTFTDSARGIAVAAAVAMAGMSGSADARMTNAPPGTLPHSPIPGRAQLAGLWDKPNEYCMSHCRELIHKGCFKRLMKQDPGAEAASIQDMCDEKYSICLYNCMCENCKENQDIIWR